MDTSAKDIIFDNKGICNYCSEYLTRESKTKKSVNDLNELLASIKSKGKNLKYDCIVGLSGGVDSSVLLY